MLAGLEGYVSSGSDEVRTTTPTTHTPPPSPPRRRGRKRSRAAASSSPPPPPPPPPRRQVSLNGIVYAGLALTADSVASLNAALQNLFEQKSLGVLEVKSEYHVTLKYWGKVRRVEEREGPGGYLEGEKVAVFVERVVVVPVLGVVVCGVKVVGEYGAVPRCVIEPPHITVCCKAPAVPGDSEMLLQNLNTKEQSTVFYRKTLAAVTFELSIELQGVVTLYKE